jgi:ABC-type nickel/cobalt efflux system permease component RcnA
LRGLRAGEAGALAGLLGLAFAYGFFHAAGPGHGKVLIGGYGAASRVRMGPLVAISLAASLMQAAVAVALVYGGVFLLGWGRSQVEGAADDVLAPAGMAAVIAIGGWLAWRGAWGLARGAPRTMALAVPGGDGVPGHHHHARSGAGGVGDDGRCGACGHKHGPAPEDIARLTGWRDAGLLIAAIGIRPCTGALFLLILTWRMGLEAVGIAGAVAMALGTALVTIAVAVLSVTARDGAHLWGARMASLRALVPLIELSVGLVVVLVAGQMLLRMI